MANVQRMQGRICCDVGERPKFKTFATGLALNPNPEATAFMRIALRVASCLLIAVVLGLLGYSAWFVTVWGFNTFALFPLYIVGLTVCTIVILALRCRKLSQHRGA